MVMTLLRVVGLLLAIWGVGAIWGRFGAIDEIGKLEQEIYVQKSQIAYGRGFGSRAGEKKIAECEQAIEKKKTERTIWFGAAAVGLVVGLGAALAPSARKRKVSATKPAAVPNPVAPGR
jgi:hypothetical protein